MDACKGSRDGNGYCFGVKAKNGLSSLPLKLYPAENILQLEFLKQIFLQTSSYFRFS